MINQKSLDRLSGIRLMIATPHYENKAYCTYVDSLVKSIEAMHVAGVKYIWQSIMGDSYVERAKNSILGFFLESDATHLLMIDSDMSWNVDGFLRVLISPYDFVAGAYPCKNNWNEWGVKLSLDSCSKPIFTEDGLIEADYAPGGFFRFSRSCIQTMWDHAVKHGEYYIDPSSAYKKLTADLFQRRKITGQAPQGEDVTFCGIWKNIGGKIYVEPRIDFGHSGIKEWKGNYSNDRT
jgi:hypothetical protein